MALPAVFSLFGIANKEKPQCPLGAPRAQKVRRFQSAPHGLFYSALPWPFFCRLRRRASMRMNSFTSSMSSAERASLASA